MKEAPNSKIQISNKHQAPSSNLQRNTKHQNSRDAQISKRYFVFGIWSFSGAWSLMFGALLFAATIKQGLAQNLLLSGATVHTVSGETFSPGQVLIQNGKITAVGA